jgi:hypothetical protein
LNGVGELKSLLWIPASLAFLLVSFGLDWTLARLQVWASQTFNVYPVIFLLIFSNLFIMGSALGMGFAISRGKMFSPLESIFSLVVGAIILLLPILPISLTRNLGKFGFMSYLNLAGALLVVVGFVGLFRPKKPDQV